MGGLRNGLRALGALLVLLLLLIGIPAALAVMGNPLGALPDLLAGDVPDSAVIAVLAAIAWVAWAQFALATAGELLGAARRRPAPRIPGVFSSQQQLARALVLAVFLVGSVGSLITPEQAQAATLAQRVAATQQQTADTLGSPRHVETPGRATTTSGAQHTQQPTTFYTVPPHGDGPGTLWDIAQDKLGDGARWQEIWHLNEGRHQPDGATMTNPSRLRPGWTVLVPTDAPSSTHTPEAARAAGRAVEVTVQAGDTLSGLAADHGEGSWQQAWHASADRAEPDGGRFTDPNLLRPGWTVALPATDGAAMLAAPASAPSAPVRAPAHEQPTMPAPAEPEPRHGSVAAPVRPPGPVLPTGPGSIAPAPSIQAAAPTTEQPTSGTGRGSGSHSVAERHEHAESADEAAHAAAQMVPVALLGGGGALLAAGVLTVLMRLRRRRFRERTLGKTISSTPLSLAPLEKALLTRSIVGVPDVNWLDLALTHLVRATGAQRSDLPEVAAARLTSDSLELVLTDARLQPPAPWEADGSGLRWSVRRTLLDAAQPPELARVPGLLTVPPYPALVSVGYTDDGDHWLLDLERLGAVSLTGDRERCLDLGRFLAAELAHNAWADLLRVDLVGFGAELSPLERVTHHSDATAAVTSLRSNLRQTTEMLQQDNSTVLHDRVHLDARGDGWPPRVLLVAPTTAAGERTGGLDGLQELLEQLRAQRSRTAVAVVLAGDSAHASDTRWQLHVDARGRLTIPALDVTVTAQQVPAEEAADLAALIALTAHGADLPMPTCPGDQPWDALSDVAGAPLPALVGERDLLPPTDAPGGDPAAVSKAGQERSVVTDLLRRYTPRTAPTTEPAAASVQQLPQPQEPSEQQTASASDRDDAAPPSPSTGAAGALGGAPGGVPVTCVLPLPAQAYLPMTATTVEDVVALAPAVTAPGRELIETASSSLDADLAGWLDPSSGLAKLTLLGPVDLDAAGTRPDKRLPFYIEIAAYLASHPAGVSAAEMGADFWPEENDEDKIAARVRNSLSKVRAWLGDDPRTGRAYLAGADRSSGVGVYRLQGVLVDAELFRRLRSRGIARGEAGMVDLQAALDLVVGPPLALRREEGYLWLVDNPLDRDYAAAVVDVAHLVADMRLAAGDADGAEAAAQVSLQAGDTSDVALLDLVAVADARGDHAQAQQYVRRILANHDAEVEEDLPPRTCEILHRRQWLPRRGAPQAG